MRLYEIAMIQNIILFTTKSRQKSYVLLGSDFERDKVRHDWGLLILSMNPVLL